MTDKPMWDDATGEPVTDPASLNFTTTDTCDCCGKRAEGTMFHAAGATGRVCAVLFACFACAPVKTQEATA